MNNWFLYGLLAIAIVVIGFQCNANIAVSDKAQQLQLSRDSADVAYAQLRSQDSVRDMVHKMQLDTVLSQVEHPERLKNVFNKVDSLPADSLVAWIKRHRAI